MSKKLVILVMLFLGLSWQSSAKTKLHTQVRFSVQAPAKEIIGVCNSAQVWLDKAKGTIQATIAVDSVGFQNNFTSEDMNDVIRDRFRTYYLESSSYPIISYKGNFHPDSLRRTLQDGNKPLHIKGTLTIHGVSRAVETEAYMKTKNGRQILMATIMVAPQSYGIRIPAYIGKMYFKEVAIMVECSL